MSTAFRHPQSTPARNQNDFSLKAPKAPDRPLVPYMRFSRKMWSKVRAENPDAHLWDIGKEIGQLWRDTPDTEKLVYQHEYEIEKVSYYTGRIDLSHIHLCILPIFRKDTQNRARANEKNSRSRMDAGGVVIQPVDEEDAGNELSSRKLAAVRFDRNHRLIADLFSPAIVTDTRTIVAQNRMDMLRKQAQSLSTHQSKLEEELLKLEEVHNEKKRLIEKGSEDFAENLKKVCEEKPQLDEARFDQLLDEWTGKLAEAYVEYKKKQDEINAKLAAEREKIVEETPVLAELVMGDEKEEKKSNDKEEDPESEKVDDEEEITSD
uniref:HMG box domain-containing protein n=1 Tax=Heterorhabditis bacteriophora TaxID=37862 RepID=A0A1I7XSX9_HETBA